VGLGSYVFCEWDSVKKEYPEYQKALAELEAEAISKAEVDWKISFGGLTPAEGQFGRTSILPALFRGFGQVAATPPVAGTNCLITWRQHLTATGHQTILMGNRPGNVIPDDFKIAWIGLMFPNKQQQITELRWQTSDRKYVRINIEELQSYNKPAIIFEEGFILNEKQAFELYAYVKQADYQRIVMLGSCFYRYIDRVLGAPGSAIQ